MFDSHPEIAIPSESHFIVPMARRRRRYERRGGFATEQFLRDLTEQPAFRIWGWGAWGLSESDLWTALTMAPPVDFADAIRKVFGAYARSQGKIRYGEKTPINVLHIALLAHLFPEGRFIHLIRDGRSVALSYLNVDFGPNSVWEAALDWRRFVSSGRSAGRRLAPRRYREVRYEDLVERPEATLRGLCDFVQLNFDGAMLRYFERAHGIVGSRLSDRRIQRPPTAGLRDWRKEMPVGDLELIEALAGGLLTDLNYERGVPVIPLRTRMLAVGRRLQLLFMRLVRRVTKVRREAGGKRVGPSPLGADAGEDWPS